MITGGLIHQHDIIGLRKPHEIVTAGVCQQHQQSFTVILIHRHMVGIADITAHRKPMKMTTEDIFQSCPDQLFGIIDIFRSHKTHHSIDQKWLIVACQTVTAAFHCLLICVIVSRRRELRSLTSFKIHHIRSLGGTVFQEHLPGFRKHFQSDAKCIAGFF